MKQRIWLAVALSIAFLAGVNGFAATSECEDVIRVGIPRDAGNSALQDFVSTKLQPIYRNSCYDPSQPLKIDFAFGSDYQMLEWLDRGAIDAAVVTDFSLWILHGRKELLELRTSPSGPALLPPVPRISRVFVKRGNGWASREPGDAYTRFLDEVLRGARGGAAPGSTLLLGSHLSTTGFLEPVTIAARHFAPHLRKATRDEREAVWRTYFRAARFTVDCDSVKTCLDAAAADTNPLQDGATVIYFPAEETLQHENLPLQGATAQERFVMVRQKAAELFGVSEEGDAFQPIARPSLDPALVATIEQDPPSFFRRIIEPVPQYGTRIFSFTAGESLRLLRQRQRRADEDQLALVLPGGGVKAAYQTGVIGRLYNDGLLWNDTTAASDDRALAVRTVIGTSGGALLGFFISQLRKEEQTDLTSILWKKEGGGMLDAEDVFAFTDVPRYFSVGAAFLIFAVLLAFFSGLGGSTFYQRGRCERPSWRLRLFSVALLFLTAPVLVRAVLGGDEVEHVPIIEGIFYTMMALIVMFVDNCVVDRGKGSYERRHTARYSWSLIAAGLLLIAGSVAAAGQENLLAQPMTFGISFSVLASMFVGAPMLLLYLTDSSRGHRDGSGLQKDRKRDHRALEIFGAIVFVLILCAFGIPGLFPLAQMIGFFCLVGIAIVTYLYTRESRRKSVKQPWWIAPLLTGVTVFFTALLCWPIDWDSGVGFDLSVFFQGSLDLSLGAFFVSVGLLLMLLGLTIRALRDLRYTTADVDDFLAGLGVMVAHTLLTIGTLYAISKVSDGYVHSLEMTTSFWITLTLGAVLFGAAFLYIAGGDRTGFIATRIQKGVRFLAGEHRNGAFVPRRYARMLVVTSLGIVWWNFVIAPAIYGNRTASDYIEKTIRRFHASRGSTGFLPTARFIATANLLERDGTYYFAFLPEGNESKAGVDQQDGAQWRTYPTSTALDDVSNCRESIGRQCQRFVHDVVFASGSPFPIFAAHRIRIPGEAEEQWFVDGGYSNNIPVDAARKVNAKQVLIVHSANPLEASSQEAPVAPLWRPGRLVMNAGRLPGFLFERSQQLDRLSRQNLFVVALAPPLELQSKWPNLAQFDSSTVKQMIQYAEDHLDERIGMVESWGQPRFR